MIVFRPSIIVTMDDNIGVIADGYLGIEDGKIEYIGKSKPEHAEEIVELPKKIIMPGFINSHTHIAMTLLRGLKDDADLQTWLMKYILPVEKLLRPSDVYYGALYGALEMIRNGITCFLDMYYHEIEVAKAVVDVGCRAMLTYGSADVFFDRDPQEEFRIAEQFRIDIESLISEKKCENKVFFAYGPHSVYGCTEELLKIFRDASEERKIRIHIHLSETRVEVEETRKRLRMTPIEYLDKIGLLSSRVMAAHVVWPTDSDIEILARKGVHVLHNPSSNLKLASGVCPVEKMLKSGINVALATDGPASNNRLDLWKEAYIAAILQKGITYDPKALPAKEALKMATINSAKALGLDSIIGSLSVGKYADFVIIDTEKAMESVPSHDIFSMIIYALDSRYIDSVWIGGNKLYDAKYGFSFIDVKDVKNKVESIRRRLIEEAGIYENP
ncbi:MAG: amidohydrolase [Candidatus Njordarchaeota archaeon]